MTMPAKPSWKELDLEDCVGNELGDRSASIEALREFKKTGGIRGIFVMWHGQGIDDPEYVDWDGFDEELTDAEIETLGTMTNRDEAGRHFTEVYPAELLERLEKGGYIEIDRPVHEATGIPYGQEEWHLKITEKTENLF